MNKRILVGIDMELSSPTQQALRVASELLEPPSSYLHIVLLTVIPTVDCIVLGSHENSLIQKIRRVIAGSTSRQVLQQAPCPIMIVVLPRTPPSRDLVAWYEEAVTRYLHEQAGRLTILTSGEVAQTFVPAHRAAGRKEVAAATHALERLASNGVLCCQQIKGELRCLND